jgi:hypothetical protein
MRDSLIKFLDEIKAYEHESGHSMHDDDRETSEIVDIHLNGNPELKNHGVIGDIIDILPEFLYHGGDGNLYFKYQEDQDLTKMWDDYKNSCR